VEHQSRQKEKEELMYIFRRGTPYWFAFVWNGIRIQKSTKQNNKKAAKEIAAAYQTALAKGEVGIDPPKREQRTVAELLDTLKTRYEEQGRDSAQNLSLLKRAKDDFGTKMATTLTREDIDKYIQRRKAEGARNSSINRVTEILRRAFKLAGIPVPPMERLSERDNVRHGFFSEVELAALISHLPIDLQDFTRFAAACGMRKSEISQLTWKMVEGDELRISASICKNRRDRVLPITGEIAEIIERRRAVLPRERNGAIQMTEFIFHRKGSPVAELRKSWQSAAIAAGLGIMVCKKCGGQGVEKYCKKCKAVTKYEGRSIPRFAPERCA
jgi:integrase